MEFVEAGGPADVRVNKGSGVMPMEDVLDAGHRNLGSRRVEYLQFFDLRGLSGFGCLRQTLASLGPGKRARQVRE